MENFYSINSREIDKLQWRELEKQLHYIQRNSGYYKKLFSENNLDARQLNAPEAFRKIPITTKEDLQRYNKDFIAVPSEEIIDWVTTSGTLGKPVSFALNEKDLQRLAENEYNSFKMVGIQKRDVVQITTTLDRRFMAGMAYFLGLRKLGAGIVRTGSGLPRLQWDSIERFQPKYLVAVPSFLLKMIEFAEAEGINYQNSSVKAAICIGEPLRSLDFDLNALGRKIKELWDIELFSTYASTEMATTFTECKEHRGNHGSPDLIFSEILDEDGNPVKPGEIGELVVTPLKTETMPLLRFATGDMLRSYEGICECGRSSLRLSPLLGRKRQLIKLKGTTIYPQSIIEALNEYGTVGSFIIEARTNSLGTDEVLIKVPDYLSEITVLKLKEHLSSRLQVSPFIEQIKPELIESLKFSKESRKPVIFKDYR